MFDLKNKLSRMFRSMALGPQAFQLEQLLTAADAGNAAEVTRAINHPKVNPYKLITDAACALLDTQSETGWKTLVECTADLAKTKDIDTQTYYFGFFYGNAGYRGTVAMVETVLTTAEKAGLGVDFQLNDQLAFFVQASDKDEKCAAISEVLIKHGADLGKVPDILDSWVKGTNRNWDSTIAEAQVKAPQDVEEFKRRKEAGLKGLSEGQEAAQKFIAAHKPPAPGQ